MGVSSGSPVHLAGEAGAKVVFVTEEHLKGDVSHFPSGRNFACVPGVNQYANLASFLESMKELGTLFRKESNKKIMEFSLKNEILFILIRIKRQKVKTEH